MSFTTSLCDESLVATAGRTTAWKVLKNKEG